MKSQIALLVCLFGIVAVQASPLQKSEKPKDWACDVCLYVVREVDKYLANQATIDQILTIADQVCDLIGDQLPFGGVAGCKIYMQTQIPGIIQNLVENQLSPEAICKNECGTYY